jgi:AraC family transcriptional activator of mtrCDE
MRHFQDRLGRSAVELLTDIRMSQAANELKKPALTTEAVADSIGYRSVAAFRRVFADRMGMTLGQWRRLAREGPVIAHPAAQRGLQVAAGLKAGRKQ